jgi:pimeloyl-ACP methyl ester carboxylesterase
MPFGRPRESLVLCSVATLVMGAMVVGGCSSSSSNGPPPEGSIPVSFTVDGLRLEGRVFGRGSTGVVLAHMLPADQRSWFDFAQTLSDQGYTALTFDFRGYCPGGPGGCSQGERDISSIWRDVEGAARFLVGRGVEHIALIGASMGGTASLMAAADAASGQGGLGDVTTVIALSAPTQIEGLTASPETLQRVSAAKLFLAGVGDATAAQAAQSFYDWAAAPKRVEILPSDDHGTDLLTGNRGEEVRQLMLLELERYARGGGS